MQNRILRLARRVFMLFPVVGTVTVTAGSVQAQERLKSMPGYDRYTKIGSSIRGSVESGAITPVWQPDGRSFTYSLGDKRYRFDIATNRAIETGSKEVTDGSGLGRPERGRQFESAAAPDGSHKVFYRDRNIWISDTSGAHATAITTDGNEKTRVKNGTASWVYGEELRQVTAMWWSPKNTKVAYYRFDESGVPDYYVTTNLTKRQDTPDIEAFPMPGVPNPVVDLFVYDVAAKTTVRVDVRDGKPFSDDVVGHYVYHVAWSPDGSELTFYRTNRKQNTLEFEGCNPDTGKCRTIVRDEWPASWVDNNPVVTYLDAGKRFIWTSERSGYRNFYLYDISGKLITPLTSHQFETVAVLHVDEAKGVVYYTARDGDNPMKIQLHRVGLDGKDDRRLTDPAFNHAITMSPDGSRFVDVAQTHDSPPVSRLLDNNGKVIAQIATTDISKFNALGLKKAELFTYMAADGHTQLYGLLQFPSNFDPSKKYPLLVSVYAGPATNGATETFTLPSASTELGFLVATLDSRSAAGRGKRFLDAIYEKLGTVEIDDQAAGAKALATRPYVDAKRVGIFGTSYGGYASVMALERYPDVFAAASSSSPVIDWRLYDSIYTERYMWTPEGNKGGYDTGSALTYVSDLKGHLLLYFGTADNNVHPSNVLQLIAALQRAGKSFDVQVGPDQGHSSVNAQRMMEFFIDNIGAAR